MHNSSKNQASFFKNRKCNSIEKKKLLITLSTRQNLSFSKTEQISSFYIILIALDDSCCVVTSSAGPFWRPFFSFFPKLLLLLLQFSTIFSHFCLRNSAFLYSLQMHIFSVISDDKKKRRMLRIPAQDRRKHFFSSMNLNSELSYLKSAIRLFWCSPHLHAICFFHRFKKRA